MPWNQKGPKTPNSGKPKGACHKATLEREAKLNAAIEAMSPEIAARGRCR